jgi:hypothetical protein
MDEETKKLYEEEVNTIVKSRVDSINLFYPHVRKAYRNSYEWPEIDPIRVEICLCFVFGFCQAATTLTNHLFETLFKIALITHDTISNKIPDNSESPTVSSITQQIAPAFDKYNPEKLVQNIDRACTIGLITKDQKKELHELRNDFRNAYSHSDKNKIFRGVTVPAQAIRLGKQGFEVGDVEQTDVAKLIFAHGMLQVKQSSEEALPYFLYMDGIARQIRGKLFSTAK